MNVRIEIGFSKLYEGVTHKIPRIAHTALKAIPASRLPKPLRNSNRLRTLSVSLVTAPKMAALNLRFRQKPYATDVLSFSRLEGPGCPTQLGEIGDVVLCPSVIRKQAKSLGSSFQSEFKLALVHGILHIFGYDHEKGPRKANEMFRLQKKIIRKCAPTR